MKQLTITPLGTGNALFNDVGNFHSNFMLEFGTDQIFIDCGSTFPEALQAAGIDIAKVKHLYISQINDDHAGGLGRLAFINADMRKNQFATALYAPQEICGDLNAMLKPVMEPSIPDAFINGIEACFDLKAIYVFGKEDFKVGNIKCTPIKFLHVNRFPHLSTLDSYGLLIEARGFDRNKKLFFTGDSKFQPETMMLHYQWADVILQDCWTGIEESDSHANFSQLTTLPEDIKKKMYLYHYGPGEKPDAKSAGFAGYALPRVPITIAP